MKNSSLRRPPVTAKKQNSSAGPRRYGLRGHALGLAQTLDAEFSPLVGRSTFDLPSCDVPSEPEVEEAWDHFQHECYELYPLNRR